MPDPIDIAKLAALSANRRYQFKRDRRLDTADQAQPTNAIYQGYDADSEQHLTSEGRSDLVLSNAGMESGQRIEWRNGNIDSQPRLKPSPEEDFILAGEDVYWAAAFARGYYEGLGLEGLPVFSRKLWLCSSDLPEPQLLYTEPPVQFNPPGFYAEATPDILIWLSYEPREGLLHVDAKVRNYGFYEGGGGSIYGLQNLDKLHWRVTGTQIESATSSEAWRAPYTNSPDNTPLESPSGFPSCLSYLWGDEVIYTPVTSALDPMKPIDHQYRHFDFCYNYIEETNLVYVGQTVGEGGLPGRAIISFLQGGGLLARIFQVDTDSCIGIIPPGLPNSSAFPIAARFLEIGSVQASFSPIDLSETWVRGLGDSISIRQGVNASSYIVYER